MIRLAHLDHRLQFPDPIHALSDPNGLLALGGDLSPERLQLAYRSGIFPWYSPGEPILWWSPDPRCVFIPSQFKPPQRFTRLLKQLPWHFTINHAFDDVIQRCASIKRKGQRGTWIVDDMIEAYQALHVRGIAHSIEAWHNEQLIGGLYGVSIGKLFFGESMFSEISGASKAVLTTLITYLNKNDYALLDCQVPNPHLLSLHARVMPRDQFLAIVQRERDAVVNTTMWIPQQLPTYFEMVDA